MPPFEAFKAAMELERLPHGADRALVDEPADPAPSLTQSQHAGGSVAELDVASAVPLPESSRGSHAGASIRSRSPSQQHISPSMPNPVVHGNAAAGASDQPTYLEKVSRLRQYFPHLRNVLRRGRRKFLGRVDCYDYVQGSLKSSRIFRENGTTAPFVDDAGQHLRDVLSPRQDADVDMRLLLVTDLSTELIEILGTCLSVNPGFFEEHLLNAGWKDSQDNPRANDWVKRNTVTDYTSVRWYRPVTGKPARGCSAKDREEILEMGSLSWTEDNKVGGGRKKHELSLLRNIFRKSWIFFSRDDKESDADAVFAWEEKATIWCKQINKVFLILLLLDPLPWMEESISDAAEEGVIRRSSTRRDANEDVSRLKQCVFRQHGIREPPIDYDSIMSIGDFTILDKALACTHSTAESIGLWLQQPSSSDGESPAVYMHPLRCLSLVMERDILNVLNLMDQALEDLALDVLDDLKLRDHLVHWRQVLARFETELAEIDDSLRKLPAYLERIRKNADRRPSVEAIGSEPDFQACHVEISRLRHKSVRSSKSFMAAISILESKRAIAEAESVTRLTELAFFFIPLTFSASIFSMQVKELNAEDLSISAFFGLAIVITASLYGLRLAIRSPLTIGARRKLMDNIRDFSGVPHGSPIGSRAFLLWIWSQIRPSETRQDLAFMSVLVGFLVNVALLAALWSRPIVRSMKVAITVALCLILVFLILCLLVAKLKFQRRSIKIEQNG